MRRFEAHWNFLIQDAPFSVPLGMGAALAAYRDELARWNRKINLVRYRDDQELARRHFLDSLAGLRFIPEGARVADIGSGAGFPGLVIALARPDLRITLVESVGKKVGFLRAVRHILDLGRVQIHHGRAEDMPASDFDRVTGRAVVPPEKFLRLAAPLAGPGGAVLIWYSPGDDAFSRDVNTERMIYTLPGETRERAVAMIRIRRDVQQGERLKDEG